MTNADATPSGSTEDSRDLDTVDTLGTVDVMDRWLRGALGRQLAIALVASPGSDADPRLSALRSALAAYHEVRVVDADASEARNTTPLLNTLRAAARADVDALLVWIPGEVPTTSQAVDGIWLRSVLGEIEDIGLRDRAFVALVGPAVTRATAHAAGYEDGWSDEPASELMARLAREVVRREEYLRRGSSPPCYLE